ncbi:hypothetical protein RUM43_012517 [Polyplax serrata]|uniref:Uncharacterized protein n=1 Tax=Polyplax serrata TaxID=468196 RepID=A0AAN8RT13_POLSC
MTVTNRRTSFVDGDKTNNKVTEKSEESGRGRAEKKPEVVIRKYPESRGIRLQPEGGGSGRQATGNCLAAAHPNFPLRRQEEGAPAAVVILRVSGRWCHKTGNASCGNGKTQEKKKRRKGRRRKLINEKLI